MTMQLPAASGTQWTVTEDPRNFASMLLYLLVYWSPAFILGWVAESWKAARRCTSCEGCFLELQHGSAAEG